MNLTTTVENVLDSYYCPKHIREILKEKDPKETVSLKNILESYGIQNSLWFLRSFEYKEYCDLLANIVEDVLPLYEKAYADGKARNAVEAIRLYQEGAISEEDLLTAAGVAFKAHEKVAAHEKVVAYVREVREGAIRAETAFNKKHNIKSISSSPPAISAAVMDIINEATKAGDVAFVIYLAAGGDFPSVDTYAIADKVLDIKETFDWTSIENHVVNFINK